MPELNMCNLKICGIIAASAGHESALAPRSRDPPKSRSSGEPVQCNTSGNELIIR